MPEDHVAVLKNAFLDSPTHSVVYAGQRQPALIMYQVTTEHGERVPKQLCHVRWSETRKQFEARYDGTSRPDQAEERWDAVFEPKIVFQLFDASWRSFHVPENEVREPAVSVSDWCFLLHGSDVEAPAIVFVIIPQQSKEMHSFTKEAANRIGVQCKCYFVNSLL